jgi:hypothetical protein
MTIHSFCPYVAESYGVNAALIYRHFCFCAPRSKTGVIRKSISELAKLYPYMGRKAVWNALNLICRGSRREPALVKRKVIGQTVLFTPDLSVESGQAHTFDAEVAADVGVVPAIILSNLRYWVRTNWKNGADYEAEKLDPANYDDRLLDELNADAFTLSETRAAVKLTTTRWAEKHPYVHLSSVHRGFAILVKAGYITKTVDAKKQPHWQLSKAEMEKLRDNISGVNMLSKSGVKKKRLVSKGNGQCQKATVTVKKKRSICKISTPADVQSMFSSGWEDKLSEDDIDEKVTGR